jgi:thiol-disulfide isomerase/thioredoxin
MNRSPFALVFFAAAGTAFAQCEAPQPVSQLLAGAAFGRKVVETQADEDARAAAFRDALAQFPDNYFILRRELQVGYFDRPEERIRVAREWHAQHPGNTQFELLEAFALAGKDTLQAIRRMEALEAAHPEMERVHIELASLFGFGRFKDKSRVLQELAGYLKLCPESIDASFLSEVSDGGTPEQVARAAVVLRRRLEADSANPVPDRWETLWRLEFKAHPLAEHPAVRRQVAEDLSRFEKSPTRQEVDWMVFLRNGYRSMGDQAAVERMSDEILETHPESAEARRTVEERWRKEHPYVRAADAAQAAAQARANLTAAREWHKRWPEDADVLYTIFDELAELPDTTAEQIATAVDEFQAAYRKNGDFITTPPIEFRIAETYLKHKIRLDQVAALVETGYRDAARRNAVNLGNDRAPESNVAMFRDSLDSMRLQAAGILLDCYTLTRQPEKVKAVMAGVAGVDTSKPFAKAGMAALRAKAAEAEGRKLDALLLYRAAMDARANPVNGADELAEGLARMWKDLGGTSEGFALLGQKSKPAEATESRWERPRNPLPSFALPDLAGKTWTLASLEGKTLLVNIWATWCGPCKAEHPEFQKLYDQLKDRPDVTVLSFNVDEDLGKVAPYIAENHYTFPVIPAKDVVDEVVPSLAIPRNWLVNAKGKLEWEQIGFGADPGWQGNMRAKLEEVIRGGK